MTDTTRFRRLRLRLFYQQGGLCHWCQKPMKLAAKPPDPRACTYEHRFERDTAERHAGREEYRRVDVAACFACNQGRSNARGRKAADVLRELTGSRPTLGDVWPRSAAE